MIYDIIKHILRYNSFLLPGRHSEAEAEESQIEILRPLGLPMTAQDDAKKKVLIHRLVS